jgi:hypothetical protein
MSTQLLFAALSVQQAAVPEPASVLLLGSGLVAAAARMRRRNRATRT